MSRFFVGNPQRVANSVRRRKILRIEVLEDRNLMAVYTPAQIMQAYGLSPALFGAANGDGQTIAIVDAYDAKNIRADLLKFDRAYLDPNASDTSFLTVVNQTGGTNLPLYNAGWSQEISLDVEWAHAIAPGAKILLVEASSNSIADLFKAVDYAANTYRDPNGNKVSVVSMSWGANEFSSEASLDSHFNVNDVSFVASSGDTGAVPIYPAVSPYVLGVGGTSLNSIGTPPGESGWNGSGGGFSAYEPQPSYQTDATQNINNPNHLRTSPDVAYDADPYTGVYVVWSGGTYAFGGTSAGAPQWAALVAIANQGRQIANAGTPNPLGATQLLNAIYNLPTTDFNDITSGSTSVTVGRGKHATTTTYTASAGYDLVTGRGSPIANSLVHDLAAVTGSGTLPAGAPAAPTGGGAGQTAVPHSFVVQVPGGAITMVDPNDAAFVASVFAAKLLPGGSQSAPFIVMQTPFVFHPFDARPDVPRPADTPRAERGSIGFTWVGENALPDDAENNENSDGTFVHNIQFAWTHHGSLCETIEQAAATAPAQPGDDESQPLPNFAPAPTRVEAAQPEEQRTTGNLVTKAIVNLMGLAGAAAFFAHGALLGRSERTKSQRDLDQRESA